MLILNILMSVPALYVRSPSDPHPFQILVQIMILRTRTCYATLAISAAYQGVAICTYVSMHDVRVHAM